MLSFYSVNSQCVGVYAGENSSLILHSFSGGLMRTPRFILISVLVVSAFVSCQTARDASRADTTTLRPPKISVVKYASGFSRPAGLAVDSMGNVFVMNLLTGIVSRINAFGATESYGRGFGYGSALAIGPGCAVYGSYYHDGTIRCVSKRGNNMIVVASGFTNPAGVCFNSEGDLYVADANNNSVETITSSGSQRTFAAGFSGPIGLAFDRSGFLYVANRNSNSISRVSKDGVVSTYARDIAHPHSLAFDRGGNLYVSQSGNDTGEGNSISVVTTDGFVYQLPGIFFGPAGLAFDRSGSLFVANLDSGFVSKVVFAEHE